ncbi:polyphenol oxidase [Marchantia polymorpha subsp. ruderalis]
MGERPMRRASWGRSNAILWASYLCSIVLVLVLPYLTQPASADPVLASGRGFCKPVTLMPKGNETNRTEQCCHMRPRRHPIQFQFPKVKRWRVRRPAHELANDVEYVNKYNLAYERMNALPADDPRSFLRQWHVHCAFCRDAYLQRRLNFSATGFPLQLHYSWTFLPWHRMLIYFHEKILGSLIHDPDFTLPFWNWDNQLDATAAQIPQIFLPYNQTQRHARRHARIRNTFLYQGKHRNADHMPPEILPLAWEARRENWTRDKIREENLHQMYTMVVDKKSAREFMGGPYTTNTNITDPQRPGVSVGESGSCESVHDHAHEWVGLSGNTDHPDNEDMGVFTYAGRDPLFYSHHANIDRLWNVWKALPPGDGQRKRKDYDDHDFLETVFEFFDENQDLVQVKVKDTLDSRKLGILYQPMVHSDSLWINHKPNGTTPSYNSSDVRVSTSNAIGRHPTSFKVKRRAPTTADLRGTQAQNVDQLSETVVLEHVRVPELMYLTLDAFIDSPTATADTDEDSTAYVGSFTHLPSGVPAVAKLRADDDMYRTLNIRFSTSLALRRLGITNWTTDITVTVVPRFREHGFGSNIQAIRFDRIRQDFT